MNLSSRLHVATRLHFALLRQYGEDVRVDALLDDTAELRETLWVCEVCEDAELRSLGRQLKELASAAPQDAAWARNTTGFGVSQPVDLDIAAASPTLPESSGWLRPARWLKRAAQS